MKIIKEFLKPNKWKVGLFILSFSLGIILAFSGFSGLELGFLNWLLKFVSNNPDPLYEWFGSWVMSSVVFIYELIYYYLLSCFIYSISVKLREKFQKNSQQTNS